MASSKEIRTKFRLEMDAPGADATKRKIEGINKALVNRKTTDGLTALSKVTARNLKQMGALQKQVQSLAGALNGLAKSVNKIAQASNKIGNIGGGKGGGGGGTPPTPSTPKAPKVPKQKQHPSFSLGLAQGLGFGNYFQPGANRQQIAAQSAGNWMGRTGKGVMGGLASTPFSGLAGLQASASAAGLIGAPIVAALSAGQAGASKQLDYQGSRLGLAPYGRQWSGTTSAIQNSGLNLMGQDKTQSNQFAGAYMGRAGGRMNRAVQEGGLQTAMAAQTLYGVSPETSGAFMHASRRGGITGAQGRAGEAQTDAIRRGVSAGMDDTEVRKLLETISSAQESFLHTGMPISDGSFSGIAGAISRAGLGMGRGMALSGDLRQQAQEVGKGGVRDSYQLSLLRNLGGFAGGGLQGEQEARSRLEQNDYGTPQVMAHLRDTFGTATDRGGLENAHNHLGVTFKEAESLRRAAFGLDPTTDDLKVANQIIKNQFKPKDATDLQNAAAAKMNALAPNVKTGAGLSNQLTDIGAGSIGLIQKMESTAQNTAAMVLHTKAIHDILDKIANGAHAFSKSPTQTYFDAVDFGFGTGTPGKLPASYDDMGGMGK